MAKWETGDSLPDLIRCHELATLYNVSLDDLIHNDENKAGMPIGSKGKHILGTITLEK